MEEKIKAIMANIFKIDAGGIDENTSYDHVERWTSIEHVEFVLNLEREFAIEFTDSQVVEDLFSFKSIVKTVRAALQAKNERHAG
jgi:acyl carrier protein